MSITVKYFASLREEMGRTEDRLAVDNSVHTVGDVWDRVSGGQKLPENLLAAVNMEYTDASGSVKDGDEVAFFPPVTGG